ncbi:MAG TPA: hypothetical protein PK961_03445 [bacterium]|nr:hypothetical protein [bacterium]
MKTILNEKANDRHSVDSPLVLLRTHADRATGFGHLMRLLSIGDALRESGLRVKLLLHGDEPAQSLARRYEFEPEPSGPEFSVAEVRRDDRPAGIFLDSYLYRSDYPAAWRAAGVAVGIVDDMADRGLRADLMINPNVTAEDHRERYLADGNENLLLGIDYMPLRRAIRQERQSEPDSFPRLLIIFGASDIGHKTAWVVDALAGVDEPYAVDVVIGPESPTLELIKQAAEKARKRGREVLVHHAPSQLPQLMVRATLAISAGGVTASELAYLGRPALLIPTAENQVAAAQRWADLNVHRRLKHTDDPIELRAELHLLLGAPNLRLAMGANGRHLVDGRGAERIAKLADNWLRRRQ